jgi:putative tricarboxylic transport membrane protein
MDASIVDAALEALSLVFSWPLILYPIAATLLAMLFSATPGLGGSSLIALAIPITIGLEPLQVMLVFGALVGGATFMGSITAILFNIPGKASNAATLLDGHPMARNGQAQTAIACAASASAMGSTFGVLLLVAAIPFLREAALLLGAPEYLMLAIWGLTTLALLTGDSLLKGLAAAGLGLQLALIGYDPRTAELRFTFGIEYLTDGLSLVPVLLGLFALAEVIDMIISRRPTLSGKLTTNELRGRTSEGIFSVFRHFGLLLRSSVIGTGVGAIPGIGSSVAGFIAYNHAKQFAGDGSRFGQGDIRGVLAPEAANDAKDGGALIPTLALGIPGGQGTALLLAVLALHGMHPGREMLTDNLVMVFVLIWSLFLSNWLTSLLGLSLASPMARLGTARSVRLAPTILVLAIVGCLYYRGLMADTVYALVFGLVGYFMKRHHWPRVPLVIALVLAPMLETNLHLTLRLQELGRIDFWSRPAVVGLIVLTSVNLLTPLIAGGKRHAAGNAAQGLWLTLVFTAACCALAWSSLGLSPHSRWLANYLQVLTLLVLAITLGLQIALILSKNADKQATGASPDQSTPVIFPHAIVFAWVSVLPLMVWLLGVSMGSALFTLAWLRWRAEERWRYSLTYAVGMGAGLEVIFNGIYHAGLDAGWLGYHVEQMLRIARHVT